MNNLPDREIFFKRYRIRKDQFHEAGLKWEDMESIYASYIKDMPELEKIGENIFILLVKSRKVHSVRYRIKDPEHLIDKIIRKKIKHPEHDINIDNYKINIKDLIGVRALHLFKEDWLTIHLRILECWKQSRQPLAYYRHGDTNVYTDAFSKNGCMLKEHPYGYRSVHYIIEPYQTLNINAEIQVRTIFEEGWSEIDHKVRYPSDQENEIYGHFLSILNNLADSADEMGSFIRNLKTVLTGMASDLEEKYNEKAQKTEELYAVIKNLDIDTNVKNNALASLEHLKKIDIVNFEFTNLLEAHMKQLRAGKNSVNATGLNPE